MTARLRRAGAPWRLLAHEYTGKQPDGTSYGVSHNVSDRPLGGATSEWRKDHVLAGCEFDELVVSKWLHVEQMDTGSWWMVVGGVTINIRMDRDGNTTSVLVEGPNDNYGGVPGARYRLVWNGHEDDHTEPKEKP